jgi:hypothetical protein
MIDYIAEAKGINLSPWKYFTSQCLSYYVCTQIGFKIIDAISEAGGIFCQQ